MSAGFTPGPWGYEPKVLGAKQWFFIVGNREGNNAEVDIGDVRGGIPTAEANARLIAAAPGLYDALEIATSTIDIIVETLADHGVGYSENATAVAAMGRAILAKARGEA